MCVFLVKDRWSGCVVVGTGAGALHLLMFSGKRPGPGCVLHTCTLPGPGPSPGAPLRAAGGVTSIVPVHGRLKEKTPPPTASNRSKQEAHHKRAAAAWKGPPATTAKAVHGLSHAALTQGGCGDAPDPTALPRRWALGTDTSTELDARWDAASNRLLVECHSDAHRSAIAAVAFPSNLSKVVAVASLGEVRLWRLDPLEEATRVCVPGVHASCVAFNTVRQWCASTLSYVKKAVIGHRRAAWCCQDGLMGAFEPMAQRYAIKGQPPVNTHRVQETHKSRLN